MSIPSLENTYIDETYQRLVQTTGSGTEFADGLGQPIDLVTKINAGSGITISPSSGVGNVTINSSAGAYNTATGSYGSFYDTGSYAATSATTIYSMSLSTTDISNGVFISGSTNPYNTYLKFTNAGVYNIQFSAQFSNSDNVGVDVAIWLRKNDNSSVNDLADTTGICTVPPKKGNVNGRTITSWNYYLNVAAGDFIQLLWHPATANVITLETIIAGNNPTHPRTPALILTAQRIDTFLSNTGSFSGSFTGQLIGTASWATSSLTSSYVNTLNQAVTISGSLALSGSLTTNDGVSVQTLTASVVSASQFTGSLFGTASWAQSASNAINSQTASFLPVATYNITSSWATNALTALNIQGGTTNYIPLWTGATTLTSSLLYQTGSILKTLNTAGADEGIYLDLNNQEYYFGFNLAGNTGTGLYTNTGVAELGDRYSNNNHTLFTLDDGTPLIKTSTGGSDVGLYLDFANNQYSLTDTTNNGAGISIVGGDVTIKNSVNTQVNLTGNAASVTGGGGGSSIAAADDLTITTTGVLTISGSTFLQGLPTIPQSYVLTYDTGSGQVSYTASSAFGGGTATQTTKASSASIASFGGSPLTSSIITFGSAFPNNNYSISVVGEDARIFTVQSKTSASFVINSNSTVALTGPVYWTATPFNP